ncbi:lipocalin-like isoform X1 [Pseudochaenichthys georgianus]|uniref:lipocalin-like isoform X1 n=1 Tax=Pseudochaenichthys georgianus TaxID=52239 RepID=UPI00146E4FB5|nr:lipocalin-like isoform X1 [Pseudochaenichthys georgianus]
MKNTLMMLVALMCALTVCADITPAADFDLQKMSGKWYTVAFASNDQWFVNNKAGIKTGTAVIVLTEGGDMDLTFANLNDDGYCYRATQTAQTTETPGRFTFHSQDKVMTIVEVVYDDYALVLIIVTKEEVSEAFIAVYSRTTEFSEVVHQKFTQLALEAGVLPDNAVILPQIAECPAV